MPLRVFFGPDLLQHNNTLLTQTSASTWQGRRFKKPADMSFTSWLQELNAQPCLCFDSDCHFKGPQGKATGVCQLTGTLKVMRTGQRQISASSTAALAFGTLSKTEPPFEALFADAPTGIQSGGGCDRIPHVASSALGRGSNPAGASDANRSYCTILMP